MFVLNLKLNMKKIFLACVILGILVAAIFEFTSINFTSSVNSKKESAYDIVINENNWCSAISNLHENVDSNINKTIKITGFVFRMPDFKENYFVCGRYTIADSKDMVAGIMCEFNESNKLLDNEWIEITGIIEKCDYNGIIPKIKVGSIQKVVAPPNTFVENNIS